MSSRVCPCPIERARPVVRRTAQATLLALLLGTLLLACTRSPPATPTLTTEPVPTASSTAADPRPSTATSLPSPVTPTTTPVQPTASASAPSSSALQVHHFDVVPPAIDPGQPVTLTWNVSGDTAVIWELDADGRLRMPSHPVPLSGTLVLTPDAGLRNWTGFHLFACLEDSGECEQAVFGVNIRCPDAWFFPNAPADCPRPARHGTMAAQPFERGWMLWLQASGEVYPFHDILVLYEDDGTPHWATYRDTWSAGLSESDPQLDAPSGLLQPVRGFGRLWRENVEVRERLGWAKEREFPMGQGALQCAATRYGRCFVTFPDSGIIALEPNASGWFHWLGPTPRP